MKDDLANSFVCFTIVDAVDTAYLDDIFTFIVRGIQYLTSIAYSEGKVGTYFHELEEGTKGWGSES